MEPKKIPTPAQHNIVAINVAYGIRDKHLKQPPQQAIENKEKIYYLIYFIDL